MTGLSPLAISALALLAEAEMHPYEMYQLMLRRREDRVLKVSAGSLYRAVERLAADGLIESCGVERSGHRPERTVYAITDAGRQALRQSLAEMLGEYVNEYPRFPVAIREARNLPAPIVARLLRERLAKVDAAIRMLDTSLERIAAKELARHFVLDVHYTRAMLEAESSWIGQTIGQLEAGELTWPAPTASGAPAGLHSAGAAFPDPDASPPPTDGR
ncbi:PadR family transcriptional regulator [Lysobacter korlensis]|uniref:PadR family transcriptional regulator n=1 Tax=Lysobacter korlensis TaxID=553636 RepID=A0ABV6RUC9_9GAMM